MGQKQAKKTSERRRGAERRNDTPDSNMPQAAVVLLAKLIAILLGTLLGFFAAYLISINFVNELQEGIAEAQSNLDSIEQDVTKMEPEYFQARDEYRRLQGKFEERVNSLEPKNVSEDSATNQPVVNPGEGNAVDSEPGTEGLESPVTDVPESQSNPHSPGLNKLLLEAQAKFLPLRHSWNTLKDNQEFWQTQLDDHSSNINQFNALSIAVVMIFILLGYTTYPLMQRLLLHTTRQWSGFLSGPDSRTTQALVGFFAGLVLSVLLLLAIFSTLSIENSVFDSPLFRLVSGLVLVGVLGTSGSLIGVTFFGPTPQREDPYKDYRADAAPKILDTSVIIDARIHEISHSGFLDGALVVTNSVLRELQTLADSSDDRKRVKGRRGLELIKEMQDDPRIDLRVYDDSSFDKQAHGTDEQLIIVSQAMGGFVVTNDYNLNRVAAIRDVRVINIHALANSVKTNHLPGDFIEIQILERGSQRGQGKGYLEDGTMVVVEDGEPYIGKTKPIKLTSVTQTAQGRMLFGRVDAVDGGAHG